MSERSTVLVVAATPSLAKKLAASLRAAGHEPVLLTSFAAARRHLDEEPRPDLLISEIKLCEYNGLHLAVRGLTAGIPAIVVGDKAFERDALQLGAVCLSPADASGEALRAAIGRVTDLAHPRHGAFAWSGAPVIPTASTEEGAAPLTGGRPSQVLH